jgi:glutathione S-transferase
VRLYVNPISPFCRTAGIYLQEKSATFETVTLATGADRALLLRVNPGGEVPALDTGRGIVAGSRSICDFADVAYPEPRLLPSDAMARAACSQLEEVSCATTDALQFLVHLVSQRRPALAEDAGLVARLDEAVREHYAFLDAIQARSHLHERPGRADYFSFTMVSSLVAMGRSIPPGLSALTAWFARVASRPSVVHDMERAARSAAAQERDPDPFFRADRIHWRSHRVEWACRLGLAHWLAAEIDRGSAYFSPTPQGEHIGRQEENSDGP